MIILKKIFNKIYANFLKIINFFKRKYYITIYKKNIELNDSPYLKQIKEKRLSSNNDICHHFDNLFYEVTSHNPKLILELGVRNGESTYVFDKIQKTLDCHFVSVDIEDCSKVIENPKWIFVKEDSRKFLNNFNSWSEKNTNSLKPNIIFIDTSHLYEETLEEIKLSEKNLSDCGALIFHDSNHNHITYLENNIIYDKFNYSPQLGVKLALENYFNCNFNFKNQFIIIKKGWLIKHYPESFGLTIMRKLK